jgi:hypothetical protein
VHNPLGDVAGAAKRGESTPLVPTSVIKPGSGALDLLDSPPVAVRVFEERES